LKKNWRRRRIETRGSEATLRTDFVFDLGPNRAKFHLPVKVSTRERVIQVWAHQRVLDGVYDTGRFLGTPVILGQFVDDFDVGQPLLVGADFVLAFDDVDAFRSQHTIRLSCPLK
jgi:hypothetical protein